MPKWIRWALHWKTYDAIGRWRTRRREVPGGFHRRSCPMGPRSTVRRHYAKSLATKKPLLAQCMVEKMLVFALGRGVTANDRRNVADMHESMEGKGIPAGIPDLCRGSQPAVSIAARRIGSRRKCSEPIRRKCSCEGNSGKFPSNH